MAEVECLADAVLVWVVGNDVFLHGDGRSHHALQLSEVGLHDVEVDVLRPHLRVAYQRVFEHLGVARTEVCGVERVEEASVDDDVACVGERPDLVLQSAEVNACLASHRCVDHGEQRCGDVDEVDAALEGGSSEAAKVGHHAATEVHEQRVACCAAPLQCCPHVGERGERFVRVVVTYRYGGGVVLGEQRCHLRQAALLCDVVGENEDTVVFRLGDGLRQVVLYVLGYYHSLLHKFLILVMDWLGVLPSAAFLLTCCLSPRASSQSPSTATSVRTAPWRSVVQQRSSSL